MKAVWTNASQDGSMLALLIRDAPEEAIALLDRKPEIDWYPANKVYETLGGKFPPEVLNWLRHPSSTKGTAYELAQFGEPQDRALLEQRLDALRKLWLSRETEMNDEAKNEEAELVSSLLSAKAWSLTREEKLALTFNCLGDPCRFYAPR